MRKRLPSGRHPATSIDDVASAPPDLGEVGFVTRSGEPRRQNTAVRRLGQVGVTQAFAALIESAPIGAHTTPQCTGSNVAFACEMSGRFARRFRLAARVHSCPLGLAQCSKRRSYGS